MTLVVIWFFNQYLIDLITNEGKLKTVSRRLQAVNLLLTGMVLVIISQFTGLYYTFDEMNRYQRAPGYAVCYVIPLTVPLLRLDGENWESDTHAENEVHIDHTRSLPGWNIWKEKNKEGMDCTVRIRREGNRVMIKTENLGIAVDSVTTVKDDVRNMYIALTGDQCALTEIRIDQNTGT